MVRLLFAVLSLAFAWPTPVAAQADSLSAPDFMPSRGEIPAGFTYQTMGSSLCCEGRIGERRYARNGNVDLTFRVVIANDAEGAQASCQGFVERAASLREAEPPRLGEWAWRGVRDIGSHHTEAVYFRVGSICLGVLSANGDGSYDPAEHAAMLESLLRSMEAKAREPAG